jgi:hypothetical protein
VWSYGPSLAGFMRRPQADRANRRQLFEILALQGAYRVQTHTLLTIRISFCPNYYKWLQTFIVLQGFCEFAEALDQGTLCL